MPSSNVNNTTTLAGYDGDNPRIPFVTLYVDGTEVPLLDAKRPVGQGKVRTFQTVEPLYLQDFTYVQKSQTNTMGEVTLSILDPSNTYLTDLLFDGGARKLESAFSFNFGWRGIDDERQGLRNIPFLVSQVSMEVTPMRGSLITIRGTDRASMDLLSNSHTASYNPDFNISSVIEMVIRETAPDVEAVIENIPIPVGEGHNRIEGEKPLKYIRSLLDVAQSKTGQNEFYSYVKPSSSQGRIQFVVESKTSNKKPKRVYLFGRDRDSEMYSFNAMLSDQLLVLAGGVRTSSVVVDPKTKTWRRIESTSVEDFHDGPKLPRQTTQDSNIDVKTPFALDKATGLIKGIRADVTSAAWRASATMRGDTTLVPFDRVGVIILKHDNFGDTQHVSQQDVHWFPSGIYWVWEVMHTISEGNYTTSVELIRNAGYVGRGDAANIIPGDLVPEKSSVVWETKVLPLENPDAASGISTSIP